MASKFKFNLSRYKQQQIERTKILTAHRLAEHLKEPPRSGDSIDFELQDAHIKSILREGF